MLSDPRIGLNVCYALAAAAGLWVLANVIVGDALYGVIGGSVYPITFLAIFVGVSALAVGLLIFRPYARVKADLLAGRGVIARWHADRDGFAAVGAISEAGERAEKRGALLLIFFFIAVIFGAFALFDPEAAPIMLAVGGSVVVAAVVALLIGNRVRRKQLEFRNGDIIIGPDGLIVNDVLHVWHGFMASLDAADLLAGPPEVLAIAYGTTTRAGRQVTRVLLPVPPAQHDRAGEAARQLLAANHLRPRGRHKKSSQ